MRNYHPDMLTIHRESILYPGVAPYTVEWWIQMSAFAYLCWCWGARMPHERWVKLDRWIHERTYKAMQAGRFDPNGLEGLLVPRYPTYV